MKSWDAIIIGGGIIGLSFAIELHKRAVSVLIVERGEPGREASYAAAGMLAATGDEMPTILRPLAAESARIYPEFVHELQDESGLKIDFREYGTILASDDEQFLLGSDRLSPKKLETLESALEPTDLHCAYLSESSVDPRTLMQALVKAAHHRGIDIASGSEVEELIVKQGRAAGVRTQRSSYNSGVIVNCAGAWAGKIGPHNFPVRPVKGQMLAVVGGPKLEHVVRGRKVYLVPRSDGRIVIGSTLEDAGFNKQTDASTIEGLLRSATDLVPALAHARQHEAWAGLRPGTPDNLPILGESPTKGYFLATGHYRDGILLAPATARIMGDTIVGGDSSETKLFSPLRFTESSN